MPAMAQDQVPAPAWKEDEWEPAEPSGHLLPLEELRNKIRQAQQEHASKGQVKVSGRTIVVCHTLPYTCSYVKPGTGTGSQSTGTHPSRVEVVAAPEPGYPAPVNAPTLPADATLPSDTVHHQQPLSPASTLYHKVKSLVIGDGKDGSEGSNGDSVEQAPHWVLKPRRVHAALNSGVKSLSQQSRVVLTGWLGDVYNVSGDKVGSGTLSTQQREELQAGFADIAAATESKHQDDLPGISCVPVWMDDATASGHYNGYCKSFLWPTFHYLGLPDHQDKDQQEKAWKAYYEANVAYAERVAEIYQEGDLIWVQDYHLLLVPRMLREKIPGAAIGLFLHSPFPSSEFFRCLPKREELLNGMLGANLCCFQTYSYGRHFLSSCVRVCGYEALDGGIGVDAKGNITAIAYSPIGIDSDRIEAERSAQGVLPKIEALRQLYKGKKIIVGRDKLDSTKGVLPKFEAYETFLELFPEWIGNVVLIQVTTPTANDSPVVARKISKLVDHINGTYGNLSSAPLHHYHQIIDREEYFALLTVADLALITSIRDGMNTTSMEYVLCQQSKSNPLILSEFTGVTGSMKEAVRVNPWDAHGCARAINQCLTMEQDEKDRRHLQLYKRVTTQTAAVWAHTLVLRLLESLKHDPSTHDTPRLNVEDFASRFKASKKRLLMFDYDGTLTPIVKVPSAAVPSAGLLKSLETLAADPRNVVYIISGRDGDFLDQHLGHIQGLGFSAEHGSFLKEPGEKAWKNLTEHIDMSWKSDVEEIFKHYEARTTGSFVEKKRASVTFHYRNADPEYGEFQAKECQALLDTMVDKLPIDVIVGKKNLEVRPAHTHKGEIVRRLTYQHADADLLICAGDDKTDEDMFRAIFAIEATAQASEPTLVVTPPPSLSLFPSLAQTLTIPLGVTGVEAVESPSSPAMQVHDDGQIQLKAQKSRFTVDNLFSIAVIPAGSRKTIARWLLSEPADLLEVLAQLAAQ